MEERKGRDKGAADREKRWYLCRKFAGGWRADTSVLIMERIKYTAYGNPICITAMDIETRYMVYSASWQLIEEFVRTTSGTVPPAPARDRCIQEFWGIRYIDDPVLRRVNRPTATPPTSIDDVNWTSSAPNPIEEFDFYHLTDVQFSTVALVPAAAHASVFERVRYDAYGRGKHRFGADVNFDGSVTEAQESTRRFMRHGVA